MTKQPIDRWIWILALALLVSNGWWAYHTLDGALLLDDQSSELARQSERSRLLASLMVQMPRRASHDEIVQFLKTRYPKELIKVFGDTIEIGTVSLQWRGDSLSAIHLW